MNWVIETVESIRKLNKNYESVNVQEELFKLIQR
jgi:hypothetical protein